MECFTAISPLGRRILLHQNLSCRPVLLSFVSKRKFRLGVGARHIESEPQLTGLNPPTLLLAYDQRACSMDKWGWVFYRCTYGDDEKWNLFKRIVTDKMHDGINFYDTPDENQYLRDTLSIDFVEDAATFLNASKDQLRVHFKKWAHDAH